LDLSSAHVSSLVIVSISKCAQAALSRKHNLSREDNNKVVIAVSHRFGFPSFSRWVTFSLANDYVLQASLMLLDSNKPKNVWQQKNK